MMDFDEITPVLLYKGVDEGFIGHLRDLQEMGRERNPRVVDAWLETLSDEGEWAISDIEEGLCASLLSELDEESLRAVMKEVVNGPWGRSLYLSGLLEKIEGREERGEFDDSAMGVDEALEVLERTRSLVPVPRVELMGRVAHFLGKEKLGAAMWLRAAKAAHSGEEGLVLLRTWEEKPVRVAEEALQFLLGHPCDEVSYAAEQACEKLKLKEKAGWWEWLRSIGKR